MDDVARDIARERMRSDLRDAKSVIELVKYAIEAGSDPAYVANRYNVDLERCRAYKRNVDERKRAKEAATGSAASAGEVSGMR